MVDEFDSMWQYSGLVNDDFGPRDSYVNFNLAMMSQIDEIESDRHLKASFIEFLEMFSRCCEKISLGPQVAQEKPKKNAKSNISDLKEDVEEEDKMSVEERQAQLLH